MSMRVHLLRLGSGAVSPFADDGFIEGREPCVGKELSQTDLLSCPTSHPSAGAEQHHGELNPPNNGRQVPATVHVPMSCVLCRLL